ncbi:response regulator [Vibrio sp. S4M6]|uniref:response regulator n=1 Tax=Vibrio sinus TaxID=2946865 RepID=UPI002029BF56|nr:response regulator [Vibrio sinus]MCL9779973.1 response regulator [Vibrio sinus]
MTRTTKALFAATIIVNSILISASVLLYMEYTQLSNYRSVVVNLGHKIIELRDQVTQQALTPTSDPYQIASSTVKLEKQVENMMESHQTSSLSTFGLHDQEASTALKSFGNSSLKIVDAIDHVIGLLVVKESVLSSLVKNINGLDSSNTSSTLAQRQVILRTITSESLNANTHPDLAPLLRTFREIESQKQRLFGYLLAPKVTDYVNRTEETLAQLSANVRSTLTQLFATIGLLIAGFIASLYIVRMKELRKHNTAYQKAMDRAEKANQAKSIFLATMSHELRTPMNGVLGMAQIMKDDSNNPKTRENVQVIIDSGQHLVSLLNDILDFSKIEQGKMDLEKAPFSIDDVLEQSNQVLKPLAEKKGIEFIVCNLIPHDLRFVGDASRMRQILFNIAGNAIKFTNKGSVEVRLILCKTPQTHVELTIADTGIGIAEDKLKHIFTPFEQAELSTTRKFGGTGLGLAIVKQITDLMGGTVSVTSELNAGTTFTLSLPLEVENLSKGSEVPRVENQQNESHHQALEVLLVEDNQVNAIVAQKFLHPLGHSVDWVSNGVAALNVLEKKQFDLIIMDNHMPNLSGVETIKSIRHELQLDTVIFACTADVFAEAHDKLIDAGANFVLTKPLHKNNLERAIKQFEPEFIESQAKRSPESNVVTLKRYPIENLTLTEEEISKSPLLADMGFSIEEKVKLLTSLSAELESKSVRLIEAYADANPDDVHKLVHAINGMAVQFNLREMAALSKGAEDIAKDHLIPDPESMQKLINLMNVNCHQTHRMLKALQTQQHRAPKTPAANKRILVADDNNVNVIVLTKLLESMGFEHFDIAKNGEEAVNLVKQHTYYAILMDNHMPVMTGVEATKIIKSHIAPTANIIACTADATIQANQEFLECGATDVILKPINKEKLLGALAKINQEENAIGGN